MRAGVFSLCSRNFLHRTVWIKISSLLEIFQRNILVLTVHYIKIRTPARLIGKTLLMHNPSRLSLLGTLCTAGLRKVESQKFSCQGMFLQRPRMKALWFGSYWATDYVCDGVPAPVPILHAVGCLHAKQQDSLIIAGSLESAYWW